MKKGGTRRSDRQRNTANTGRLLHELHRLVVVFVTRNVVCAMMGCVMRMMLGPHQFWPNIGRLPDGEGTKYHDRRYRKEQATHRRTLHARQFILPTWKVNPLP